MIQQVSSSYKWVFATVLMLLVIGTVSGIAASDSELTNPFSAVAARDNARAQTARDSVWFTMTLPLEMERAEAELELDIAHLEETKRLMQADTNRQIRVQDMMSFSGVYFIYIAGTLAILITAFFIFRLVNLVLPARKVENAGQANIAVVPEPSAQPIPPHTQNGYSPVPLRLVPNNDGRADGTTQYADYQTPGQNDLHGTNGHNQQNGRVATPYENR